MEQIDIVDDTNFISEFKNILFQLREKFDTSVIFVSSIFPRRDRSVVEVKSSLLDMVDVMPKFRFIPNQTLNADMLRDNKHLNKEGFSVLLGSIRYSLFGKLPKFRQTNFRQPRYHHSNRYGNNNRNTHRSRWNNNFANAPNRYSENGNDNFDDFWNNQ